MSESQQGSPHPPLSEELQPLALRTQHVVFGGTLAWLVALALILTIPALHQGDRHWWPWTCVAGIALGAFGYAYVRRGRGNASDAR